MSNAQKGDTRSPKPKAGPLPIAKTKKIPKKKKKSAKKSDPVPRFKAHYTKKKLSLGGPLTEKEAVVLRLFEVKDAKEYTVAELVDRVTRFDAMEVVVVTLGRIPRETDELVSRLAKEGLKVYAVTDGKNPYNSIGRTFHKTLYVESQDINSIPYIREADRLVLEDTGSLIIKNLVTWEMLVKANEYRILPGEKSNLEDLEDLVSVANGKAGPSWRIEEE